MVPILLFVSFAVFSNAIPSNSDAEPNIGITYYISSSTGNDQNDGLTPDSAWQTFDNLNIIVNRTNYTPVTHQDGTPYLKWDDTPALSWLESYSWGMTALKPGDKIALKRGDTWNRSLHLMGKGNYTAPIILTSYGEGILPIIQLSNQENESCVQVEGASYWIIENLDLRGAKLGLYLHYWEDYENRDVIIRNCKFQDSASPLWDTMVFASNFEYAWSCGIFLGGRANGEPQKTVLTGWAINNCTFQNCTMGILANWYWPAVNHFRLQDVRIENCTSYGGSTGFALNHMSNGYVRRFHIFNGGGYYTCGTTAGFIQYCENFVIEGCIFANQSRDGVVDGVGFDFEGDSHNITFRHNVIFNNDGAGILMMDSMGKNTNIRIQNCLLYNNCRNPARDELAYEMLNYASSNSGVLQNISIYRGDDLNRVTGQIGLTYDFNKTIPSNYSIDYMGSIKNDQSKWRHFKYEWKVKKLTFDPAFDYTTIWPECVMDERNCPPINATDTFLITMVLLGCIGGVIFLITINHLTKIKSVPIR
jgi:hypothetical protein